MARETGQSVHALWNRSWAVTLHADYVMRDQDEMARFREGFARWDQARLTGYAFSDTAPLNAERAELRQAVMDSPFYAEPDPAVIAAEHAALRAKAAEILAKVAEKEAAARGEG